MKWLVGISLTLLLAFIYGQASSIYAFGKFSDFMLALWVGLLPALITGILGPYFLLHDPNAKAIVSGIILWIVLLGIYWLVTSGLLVTGPLIQHS